MALPHFPHFVAMIGLPFHPADADSGCGIHLTGAYNADE
jgi:hypothetical protein